MPNTTVRAAAEGMPNASRRTALTLTATGLFASLMTVKVSATETMSRGLAALIDEYNGYAELSIDHSRLCQEADRAPDRPCEPLWQPTGIARRDIAPGVRLTSAADAEEFFAEAIDNARHNLALISGMPWEKALGRALIRGHGSVVTRLEMFRAEAIATLRMQEEAYAPYLALEEAADAATAKAADVLDRIYAEPCHTLADVRAKAAVMIHAGNELGLGLYERDHVDVVLKSLLGEQEA